MTTRLAITLVVVLLCVFVCGEQHSTMPVTIGLETLGNMFQVVVAKGTPLPATHLVRLSSSYPDQAHIHTRLLATALQTDPTEPTWMREEVGDLRVTIERAEEKRKKMEMEARKKKGQELVKIGLPPLKLRTYEVLATSFIRNGLVEESFSPDQPGREGGSEHGTLVDTMDRGKPEVHFTVKVSKGLEVEMTTALLHSDMTSRGDAEGPRSLVSFVKSAVLQSLYDSWYVKATHMEKAERERKQRSMKESESEVNERRIHNDQLRLRHLTMALQEAGWAPREHGVPSCGLPNNTNMAPLVELKEYPNRWGKRTQDVSEPLAGKLKHAITDALDFLSTDQTRSDEDFEKEEEMLERGGMTRAQKYGLAVLDHVTKIIDACEKIKELGDCQGKPLHHPKVHNVEVVDQQDQSQQDAADL